MNYTYKVRIEKNMKIAVPIVDQTTHFSCDLASVEGILQYYDKTYTRRTLLAYLHLHSYGSLLTEMADCLVQHGVQTTIVSANPHLFSRQDWDQFVLKSSAHNKKEEFHMNELHRVIKNGVYLVTLIPTAEMIEKQLDKKQPVIISCNWDVLHHLSGVTFDYAIISGYDKDTFQVVDAFHEKKVVKYPKSVVMYAIHSLTAQNPLAGSIILTADKKEVSGSSSADTSMKKSKKK
jgi:hypothetical protein